MIYVTPTILVNTQQELHDRVLAVKSFFTRAQVDVMNNTLVEGNTFNDIGIIEKAVAGLTCEVDLMVLLDGYDCAQWNRPWGEKIIFHIEATDDPKKYIQLFHSWGKKVFLSINPDSDPALLEPHLKEIDGVLFMTVQPGRSGNPFQPQVLDTIQEFRKKHKTIEIEVDGGVTNETIPSLLDVGVNGFAVGSYLDNKQIEERSLSLISLIEQFESKMRTQKSA